MVHPNEVRLPGRRTVAGTFRETVQDVIANEEYPEDLYAFDAAWA